MTETPQGNGTIENILGNVSTISNCPIESLIITITNLVTKLQCTVIQNLARIQRAAAFKVVVEDWRSTDATREADGELPRWVHCTENDLSNGCSAQLARVELLDNGVSICGPVIEA